MINIDQARAAYLEKVERRLDFDALPEFRKKMAKKYIDYAFSQEFKETVQEEEFRLLHPALQDLYNQYQEMLVLIRKEAK